MGGPGSGGARPGSGRPRGSTRGGRAPKLSLQVEPSLRAALDQLGATLEGGRNGAVRAVVAWARRQREPRPARAETGERPTAALRPRLRPDDLDELRRWPGNSHAERFRALAWAAWLSGDFS